MCIYIITDDVFFFTGLKSIMRQRIGDEYIHLHSDNIFSFLKGKVPGSEDIFIIASECLSLNLMVLLYLKNFMAKLLVTENKTNRALYHYLPSAVIKSNATAVDILTMINLDEIKHRHSMFDKITERERVILLYTLKGISVRSIKSVMKISIKTIYSHRKNGLSKLGVRSLMDLLPE